jgi:hypothetical protein
MFREEDFFQNPAHSICPRARFSFEPQALGVSVFSLSSGLINGSRLYSEVPADAIHHDDRPAHVSDPEEQ